MGRKAAGPERCGDVLGWIVKGGGDAGVDESLVAGIAVCGCGVGECCDWVIPVGRQRILGRGER